MNNYIIFVDSRGVIASNLDTFQRHKHYVAEYNKRLTKESNEQVIFQIISGIDQPPSETRRENNFQLHCIGTGPRFSLKYILRAYSVLRSNRESIRGFICGDPWETFWTSYILRMALRNKAEIQVNIHADVFDSAWVSQSLTNRFRKALLTIAIKKASNFRVVSLDVKREIESRNPRSHVIYAPIPIMNMRNIVQRKNLGDGVRTIGWIGRIAEDRGIRIFVEFLFRLNSAGTDFKVLIAGTGPLQSYLEERLRNFLNNKRVCFLGQVSQPELQNVYGKIDVLVSCAKSESYGLSIRESLLFGTPVWAVQSKGVIKLQSEIGHEFVRILDLKSSDENLKRDFDDICRTIVPANIGDSLQTVSQMNLDALFDSWDMMNNFGKWKVQKNYD